MKSDVGQRVALAAASFVAVVLCIVAGSSASGGGGWGSNSQNNPGMQGNHLGQAASGPGFGQGNNSGVEGSANGRSIASDASSGRSGDHTSFFSPVAKEEVIDTDVDKGRAKATNQGERDANHSDTTGSTHVLTRISSETGVPVQHTTSAEVGDQAWLW
jgi:hypothetical protein